MIWWLPPAALLLDMLLPDPRRLPHPVQAIGRLANVLEKPARRSGHPILAGTWALALLLLASGAICAALVSLPFPAGFAASLYLAWSGLALGGLVRDGNEALVKIERAQMLASSGLVNAAGPEAELALTEARHAVQMLVSRDTSSMDAPALCRSLAESVSENCNDAFVAPYFWLCLGGPVGLWLYKTASTMDSMWGYKNERWLYLGRASAKLDDVLAFIPARLCVLLMLAAHGIRRLTGVKPSGRMAPGQGGAENRWPGWRIVAAQARQAESPNAGWPMAAAAWLLGGRCGGPTPYDGKIKNKTLLGPPGRCWTTSNTRELLGLVRTTGLLGAALGAVFLYLAAA